MGINSSDVTQELINSSRINVIKDKVPSELYPSVMTTIELNPTLVKPAQIVKSVTATNSTGSNIYTTPTNADFYLTSIQLAIIKDVTSTSVQSDIFAYIDGQDTIFMRIPTITLTVQESNMTLSYTHPIKIDRGTVIRVANSTNVANIKATATITGYILDSSKG